MILIMTFALLGGRSAETNAAETAAPSGMVTITANERTAPPAWALLERHLIAAIEEAAPYYIERFTNRGGTLKTGGKLDDDYECFAEWPLFYVIGGDEKIFDWGLEQYNAITRQWTYQRGKTVYREFVGQYDMLHLSEGYVGFQYFGLADPTIPENIERSKRFAELYLGEDSEAPNYDPAYRVIRSIATGSRGPAESQDCVYVLNFGHSSLYPVVKELEPGWERDRVRRAEIQKLYDEMVTRCDVPMNLTITGLVTNAYLSTGEEKYRKWVLDYVDAWMERIEANNGIIPDNIGRTGKIGEYRDGQWWGGFFGWSGRYSITQIFRSLITASECAHLLSGDDRYLDLLRSQVRGLFDRAKTRDGNLVVPYRYGPEGWYDYRPLDAHILSHLWHASMSQGDWRLIEKLREGTKNGPWAISVDDASTAAVKGKELWHSDGTVMDWNEVHVDLRRWQNIYNEPAYLNYLAGLNPDWPEKIMQAEYEHVCLTLERMRDETYRHEWASQTLLEQNPVLVNGLRQVTMGCPHVCFNGGLLRAQVRYFDLDRTRPGLPRDVAALIKTIERERVVVELVNTSLGTTRRLIIQAGAYGEHEFTEVSYLERVRDTVDGSTGGIAKHLVDIGAPFFVVELPPSTTIELELGMERYVNTPSFATPWQGR